MLIALYKCDIHLTDFFCGKKGVYCSRQSAKNQCSIEPLSLSFEDI
jgi:hypothetical protein